MIKNIIFDLGAVMFNWNPQAIVESFTRDRDLQQRILDDFYFHQNWMDFDCGHITEAQAIQRAVDHLFISTEQATRLLEITKQSLVLIPLTEKLLQDVKQSGLSAYCLSNISPELFEYLSNRNKLFKLFDGIVISGEENIAKPDPAIFEVLLNRFKLTPEECFFIDDSQANTESASKLGISSLTFRASSSCYQQVYKLLENTN